MPLELRASSGDEESRVIEGYAALFNVRSELMYDFYEVIAPSAFDEADLSDIRALFNHDPNSILARTSSGTLEVEVNEKGLFFRFEPPNNTLGNDLLESVRRGDISQSSFAFTLLPDGDNWSRDESDDMLVRTITKIDRVFDIAPVTYPAYALTTVSARNLSAAQSQHKSTDTNFLTSYRSRQIQVKRLKNIRK